MATKKAKKDIYQDVTNRIITALETGTAPWVKPWKSTGAGDSALPFNGVSGNNYQGVNTLLLWSSQMAAGYSSNTWLTFKQAKDLGGNVIKGEKSTPIIYYQMCKREDKETGETHTFPMLKQYFVFNFEQCEGIDPGKAKVPEKKHVGYTDALYFALNAGATINHGGDSAHYAPGQDKIQMPNQSDFKTPAHYEATLLHELTHWTGHKSRLDRLPGLAMFGDESYAFEELVAEMGSAFLSAELGVPHEELQHDSYLASWLRLLKDDKKAIFKAAKLAQQASDFLMVEQAKSQQAA